MSEQLMHQLKDLKLTAFEQYYPRATEQALQHTWSHGQFLSYLCEQEQARRYASRIANWTLDSKLPSGKSFATLDLHALPAAVTQRILTLKENLEWARQADNVLLVGPSGVGKSHLASALGHHLITQGIRVKWLSATGLVQQLQQAKKELELMSVMSRLDKYRVVILDDIGYVKKTEAETHVLFEWIAHRYESGSLIITSNHPFSHWDQIFPDQIMTVAAIDRIIHHATIIEINSESYRRKNSKVN